MDPKHIFDADGRWVCFIVGEDVFSKDGEYLGSLSEDGNSLQDKMVSLLQA